MSVRVIVVRRENNVVQVFPASLVGERGEKKCSVHQVSQSDASTNYSNQCEKKGATVNPAVPFFFCSHFKKASPVITTNETHKKNLNN